MNDNFLLPISIEAQAFALRVAVSGACVCGIVLLIDRLLRRRSEPLRHSILMAGIVGLVTIPALVGVGASVKFWPETPPEDEIVKIPAEMLPQLLNPAPAHESADEALPASSIGHNFGAVLMMLWLLGAALGLGRLFWALLKQSRALVGQPWRADFWTEDLQRQLAAKLGLARFPAVCMSPAAPMPMVIGLFRPTIVLPEKVPASWDQAKWQAILLHEAAHIARRDHWAIVAQRIAILLFWWCPLVHLMSRRLNALRENICDDHALEGPCDQLAYAELLVESAERFVEVKTVPVSLALLDSARGGLEARVTRLLEKEKRPMTKLTWIGKIAAAGCLVLGCLLTTAAVAFSQPPAQPAKKVQIKIIVDGKEIDLSEHLDAALKKPAPAGQDKPGSGKPNPNVQGRFEWEMAISPDGKVLRSAAPGKVFLFDTATGKVIAQHTQPAVQPDPRVEELVKAAEKIKPGSGAEVRKALKGAGKTIHTYGSYPPGAGLFHVPVPGPGTIVQALGDKKIIILSVQDGKVQQLSEQDLKKLLEQGQIRFRVTDTKAAPSLGLVPAPGQKAPLVPGALPAPGGFPAPGNKAAPGGFPGALPAPFVPKTVEKAPTPAPGRTDLEALQRQLERINAELLDLRKRLDAGKK